MVHYPHHLIIGSPEQTFVLNRLCALFKIFYIENWYAYLMEIERFDSQYSTALDLQIEILRYAPIRFQVKDKVILDLGCGNGYSSKLLSSWGAKKVFGVDIDCDSIKQAQSNYTNSDDFEFICGPAERINELIDFSIIDGVCFVECLEHVLEPELVLRKLAQNVRTECWVYITVPNDDWNFRFSNSDNEFHLRRFTKESFLSTTSKFLGPSASSGEIHAAMGLLAVDDRQPGSCDIYLGENNLSAIRAESFHDSHLNSSDSLCFYAGWAIDLPPCTSAMSAVGMDVYTHLFDRAVYDLPQEDINNFRIRDLLSQIETLRNELSELNNRFEILSLIGGIKSISEGVMNQNVGQVSQKWIVRRLNSILLKPNAGIILIYRIIPISLKQKIRSWRSGKIMKNEL